MSFGTIKLSGKLSFCMTRFLPADTQWKHTPTITSKNKTQSQKVRTSLSTENTTSHNVQVHFVARRAASVVEVPRLRLQLPDQALGVEGRRRVSEGELGGRRSRENEVFWGRELLGELAAWQRLHSACETTCSSYYLVHDLLQMFGLKESRKFSDNFTVKGGIQSKLLLFYINYLGLRY